MIQAIIRPEKADFVMDALLEAGFPAVTRIDVLGRGKQLGLTAGGYRDALPKEMLMLVVPYDDKDFVLSVIMNAARTGDAGMFGDGKVIVSPVSEFWTVSTGDQDDLDNA